MILEEFDAEMYFFVLADDIGFTNGVITSGYYNTAATNSLFEKIVDVSPIFLELSFYGHIKMDNHIHLKRCIQAATDRLSKQFSKSISNDDLETEKKKDVSSCIDLTLLNNESDDDYENDDDLFYEYNTSEISSAYQHHHHVDNDDRNEWSFDKELLEKMFGEECTPTNLFYKSELSHTADEDEHGARKSTKQQLEERSKAILENSNAPLIIRHKLSAPTLNRGNKSPIEFTVKIPVTERRKKPFKSNLFNESESEKWRNTKLGNENSRTRSMRSNNTSGSFFSSRQSDQRKSTKWKENSKSTSTSAKPKPTTDSVFEQMRAMNELTGTKKLEAYTIPKIADWVNAPHTKPNWKKDSPRTVIKKSSERTEGSKLSQQLIHRFINPMLLNMVDVEKDESPKFQRKPTSVEILIDKNNDVICLEDNSKDGYDDDVSIIDDNNNKNNDKLKQETESSRQPKKFFKTTNRNCDRERVDLNFNPSKRRRC